MTVEELIVTAPSPMLALERLLTDIVQAPNQPTGQTERYLLGFHVEARDLTTLVQEAVAEIYALAHDQAAIVITCDISGFHETDDGHRLWGTIECGPATGEDVKATRVDHVTLEMTAPGQWRLGARRRKKDLA